jgi:hypothetical protein
LEWSFSGRFLSLVIEYKMAANAFEKRTGSFITTSLDRFIQKYSFYDRFINKTVYASQNHLNIGPFGNRTQIDHKKTGLVRFSDVDCN